ncbi:MAG TPA: hypothetical protein DDW20_01980 [Firmicutes bacterium]|nr:hypothetical protein [Bacillota bacterium]
MKLDVIYKISLSGLILALAIICTRFLSIQNIPFIPFVRISLGPALIIFASIFLGPVYGGIIGGASDILGIILVPNALGYSINPWISLVYLLLGVVPYFLFKLFRKIKSEKIMFIVFTSILLAIWLFILVYGLTHDSISSHTFVLYEKIIVFVTSFALLGLTDLFIILLKRKHKDNATTFMNVSFVCLISEIFILTILNSLVKAYFFEVDFWIIFFAQAVIIFINVPLNAFVVTYLLRLTNKIFNKENKNV